MAMPCFYALQLGEFQMRQVACPEELQQQLAFRHKVFREQLGWVPVRDDGLDSDRYDGFSDNLALWHGKQVVGSVRFTLGSEPFMLEHEFSRLLVPGETLVKGRRSAEITRFAIDGQALRGRPAAAAAQLLYLSLWQWAAWNRIRWMYFVVEPRMYRRLAALKFPIQPVGVPRPLDGGVLSMAGCFDWSLVTPEFIQSMQQGVTVSDASQERLREYDYSH
nr:acyl-homoserine-lactone synthase [Chromobacterium sp. ASV5]